MSSQLSHVNHHGEASMVDVSSKKDSIRTAKASAIVKLPEEIYQLIQDNNLKKGDVLSVSKLAGIMGAKQCSTLIPLCHNIPINQIQVDVILSSTEDCCVLIKATVKTTGKTGVEMEALTAVSISALTVYDMCKAVTHNMTITDIKLVLKSGGKSDYSAC